MTSVTLNCGGNDTVTVGDSLHRLDGIQGTLTVNGESGTALIIDDQGTTTDEVYEVFATEVDRTQLPDAQGNYVPDMAPSPTTTSRISRIHAGGGSYNLLYVESTAAGTATDVYGGSNNSQAPYTVDEFIVSGGPGDTLDSILTPLNLHGQSSTLCPLLLNDASTLGVQTYTLTAGAGIARVSHPLRTRA